MPHSALAQLEEARKERRSNKRKGRKKNYSLFSYIKLEGPFLTFFWQGEAEELIRIQQCHARFVILILALHCAADVCR